MLFSRQATILKTTGIFNFIFNKLNTVCNFVVMSSHYKIKSNEITNIH